MTISNHPVLILTCKLLKERRRRLFHTIWEITSGVLVFVMLLLMRQVIKHSHFTQDHSDGSQTRLNEIIYTPNNEMMQTFMTNVANNFGQKHGRAGSALGLFKGFPNETAVDDYMASLSSLNSSNPIAVISFKDVNTTFPNLDYTIKLVDKSDLKLHRPKLKQIPIHEPLNTKEHANLPLMKLQWAIDRTFMERVTGINISHRVSLPHFRSNSDTKTPMAIIHQFLIFCTVAAPLPFFLYNSSRLVNERRSGLKELMKIVGVSLNEVRLSHVMATAVLSTIYASLITMMLKATSTPILPRSNSFIIAWTIILHFMNVTSLAFVTTALSQDYQHANGLALVVYIMSCVLCKIWYNTCHTSVQVYLVSWFLPHAPVYMFWDEVKYLEFIGKGASFSDIATQHTPTCVPVLLSWTVFVVQQAFIMTLAWYLDMVNPGSYGVAQKWNFLFKKQYWTKKRRVTFHVTVEQTRRVLRDDRFFEKGPMNSPIVIKLTKVTKIFGGGFRQPKVVALDKVSLDIYEGEITVVLGINGAGKSTLMSVVTGMTAATKGKVYVNGFDNTTAHIREIRKNLGLCPQQNLTFDYLTVRENIILFERLRGPKREARTDAENLIRKLHLEDKADFFSYQLSTSGERCLQVACALAGGADVLVLDEPTSNCDAETRSDLWDAILVLRGDKTVLMTTTSIEEADALGDRIALLSHGKLKCYGTPLFLKSAIGTGFNLSVTLKHKRNMDTVRQVIGESLPEAVTTKIDHKRILFTLPAKDHELFPKLFDTLEERREELGIAAMGVGMSLEEMFLGFIDEEDDDDPLFVKAFQDVERLKGWALHFQQLKVLIKRNFFHMWSFKYQFIILQIMVPVFGLIVITVTLNSSSIREGVPEIEVNQFDTLLLSLGVGRSDDLDRFKSAHPGVNIVRSHKVSNDFANYAYTHDNSLLHNVIGISMDDNHSSIYFPVHSLNEASVAINMFSNFYMLSQMPGQYSPIRTRTANPKKVKLFIPKENILCLLWAMWVTIIITLPLTPFIGMLISEYKTTVRYTHFVVGCPFSLHWLAKLASHTVVFLAIIPLAVFLCARFLDFESTLTQGGFLAAVFMAQLLFLPAFLLQLYVLSFFLDEDSAMSQIYIMSIALGFISSHSDSDSTPRLSSKGEVNDHRWLTTKSQCHALNGYDLPTDQHHEGGLCPSHLSFSGPLIQILLVHLSEESNSYVCWMEFFTFVGRFSPVFTLSELIAKFASTARVKAYCDNNDRYCNYLISDDYSTKTLRRICCEPNKETFGYFSSFDSFPEIFTLLCHSVLYSIMLIAVQNRYIQNILGRMLNFTYKEKTHSYRDLNVYHEKANVKRMMTCIRTPKQCVGEKPAGRILLVDDLHKNYVTLCQTRPMNAVRGVSFSVKGGESIGLLGPPGSGKTSALSMIAGRQSITRGDCCLDGWFLRMQRSEYISKVSLVKCTGGLDEFYTGYENLKILCLLRGYNESQADTFTMNCMTYMGLQHLTHTSVRRYSAGCARLLRLCAALLAAPPAVLLDEPMLSVDPHSRPLVARALARLTSRGSAVVLAEQSLNWRDIDTLCSRIAVFTNGQISALGSSRHVRAMLANGHTARLKLKLKPIRTSISVDSTLDLFSKEYETEKNVEAIKARKEKRRLEILAAKKHFNDPDDDDDEFDNSDEKNDSAKSTQHDIIESDRGERSSSRADISKKHSQQAARDERRHYLTSRQASEYTETEENDDYEDIKKVYRKSRHDFIRIQPDDEDEDDAQAENANPDKAQATSDEIEISETVSVPKESIESSDFHANQSAQPGSAVVNDAQPDSDRNTTDQAITSQPESVQLEIDNNEDNAQAKNANTDEAQATSDKIEITETTSAPKESIESSNFHANQSAQPGSAVVNDAQPDSDRNTTDQAITSQPKSVQLENVESKIDQPVTSRAVIAESTHSEKDQKSALEDQQSIEELKVLLMSDEVELAEPLLIRDDSNVRFLRDNNLKGTVYADLARDSMKRNVISLSSVQALKTDFKNEFPTSKLADEHLSMLHFHIKGDKTMTYSSMFSKLEKLKTKYENIIEDYTLSEISIDDVYSLLAKETI